MQHSEFIIPENMQKYASLSEFLDTHKNEDDSVDLFNKLMLSNINSSIINMDMFTVNGTVPYSQYKIPHGWEEVFNTDTCKYELTSIMEKLKNIAYRGNTIFPLEHEIFNVFELCPLDNIKVVIIGQDPYPSFDDIVGLPMACGLSFSGRLNGKKPSSLNNVFKEIKRTFPNIALNHYDLTSWAKQGVFLLNTSLTVNQGQPESHIKERVWNYFTEYIIRTICEKKPGTIFCLWGAKAKALANGNTAIISKTKCHILEAGHPSSLNSSGPKFAENDHFAHIYFIIENKNKEIYTKNIQLHKEGKEQLPYVEQINWQLI